MQHCEFCGYLLPEFARFCGNCGRIPGTGTEAPSNISTPSDVDVLSLEAPTFISSPSHPVVMSEEEDDLDVTIRRLRSEGVEIQSGPFSGDGQTEETQAVLPDLLLPGALMADGQASARNVPMVQGTPQMGGVPMVHGTPQVGGTPMVHGGPPVPGSPTTGQSFHHGEASSTHLSPHTPLQYHGLGTSPAHPIHPPPQPIHPPAHPIHPPLQPIHPPAHPVEPPTQPLQPPTRGHKQHHTGQSHTHRQHTPPHHKGPRLPRLRLRGSGLQWIMVAAVAIVALVSGALGLTFALLPPAPSISLIGSSSVVSGGTMHLHGKGFVSGGSITLTLDNRVPLSYQGHIAIGEANDSGGMGAATALHLLIAGQVPQPATSQGTIRVRSDGTFDTTVIADANWSLGSHTIRATEDPGSRSATLPFNFIPGAKLSLRPTSLDLGKLSVGSKVSLSIIVSNAGGQRLKWTADTGGTTWLKVVGGAGLIERGSFQQVALLVDTSHLKARDYSAILHITSNGGHKDVGIKLNVTRTVLKQAKLYVDPTSLDFGKLAAGQPMTLTVTVGNVGTKVLNWTTDIGNTSWLSLDTNAGMIQPGGQPQTIQVTADPTGLAAGNHSATLQINSDGGSASVGVTLVVAAPPPGGLTPTPSPPPQLAASPNGFSAPGDPNCSYNQTQGWACTVSLNSYKSAQGDLNWSSSSSVSGVTFAPSSGTLSPGQTAKVTVTIPNTTCPAQADFHFTGPGNAVDVLWSCAAPQLLASPTSFSNGCLSCTVTLALAQGSEGSLSWAATSSGISGITISQQSGTLTAGQTTQVTFTVPNTNCPANADFHFTGPGNGVDVPWSCQLSPLGVSPTSINANTDCSYSGGWTCTVTLSSQQNAQSNINWAASGGISGTSFSPSSGTLSPGQSSKVTINVPSTNCTTQANITFSGGLQPVTVSWSCSPSTLIVSPSSFSVPASTCSYTSGQGWTCTATLSLKYPGDPNLDWSTFSSVGGCCPIQFTPSSGTLSAGQQTQVTITIPDMTCPTSLTLSFLPSGQNAVNVPWNCAAPTWSATPNQNICPQNSDGSWTCIVTVAEASSSQGDLAWSASSQLTGVTFSPQSGTLSPGKSVQVTIAVPANDCTNSSFNFSEQGGNTITIQVQCASPPTLAVSPTSLSDSGSSPCTYDSGSNSWTCTVTLTEDASSQGNLNWSASSTLTGVSFSSQSGTLSPGQSVQVTISGIPCTSSSNAFTFSGGASPVTVSWNCGS